MGETAQNLVGEGSWRLRRATIGAKIGSREGAEYINNPYRAIPAGSAFEQALNRDFHPRL
jgi:hypothetical protein